MKKRNRQLEQVKIISFETLLVAVIFIVSIFLFALIVHEVFYEKESVFDTAAFKYFAAHTSKSEYTFMTYFTVLGNAQFLIPVYLIFIIFFIIKKNYRRATNIAIIAGSSALMMSLLKLVFHRTRPTLPFVKSLATYSFPSGHAVGSFIFATVLVFIIRQSKLRTPVKWLLAILCLIYAVLIGISRIILHMHYATDVIAGFCFGIVWVIISIWILRRFNYKRLAAKDV